ncbi:MAG: hypothetical protein IKO36_00825 [Bacteroidaceae bacterium]|nr:hypothetical protein [Bacteroidaceae bacterium]
MINRDTFKFLIKSLQQEEKKVGELVEILAGRKSVNCHNVKSMSHINANLALQQIHNTIIVFVCEYLKIVDTEFYDNLASDTDFTILFEHNPNDDIVIYATNNNGEEVTTIV